jgi:UDP-N-acetylglucosamine/UDP-N-acetylgalactosamine diphosphorylase
MLPFIDDRGRWLLEEPGKIAEGPDGNGHALRLFYESGLWEKWRAQGIEHLNIIVVDNALADPFDPEFIGFAHRTAADVALKAVARLSKDEKMGVIAERDKKLKLIEYSELTGSGSKQFTLSNTGLFCMSMEFIRHLYQDLAVELPLHLARKTASVLLGTSKGCFQEKAYVWKCERFIFDLFDYARTSSVLVCPREKIYAPLKNATGDKDLESVRQALFSHYRDLYQSITGRLPSANEFELAPAFYYPSVELKQKLSQLSLSDKEYVNPLIR